MNSTSLRASAAPSSQLLKFLRAQNSVHARPSCKTPGTKRAPSPCIQDGAQSTIIRSGATPGKRRYYATLAPPGTNFFDNSCISRTTYYDNSARGNTGRPLESSLSFLDRIWQRRKPSSSVRAGEYQYSEVHGGLYANPQGYPVATDRLATGAQFPRFTQRPHSTRSLSSTSSHQKDERFLRRFWPGRDGPTKGNLQPDDLPPLSGVMGDETSVGRLLRSANELRLRCTEFDENGNVTVNNGEFKKSELIAKYGLLPRDLRKIDSSMLPNILVRPSVILINLLHLRVLIKGDRVLVFDAYGSTNSYSQSLFMYDLENKLRSPSLTSPAMPLAHSLPYEFRALEAVLISVTSGLESEFEGVREPVVRVLRELEEDIDRDKLRHLLIYSKKLGTFEQKARLVRDAIDDLLEADDDLADMYLTEKATGVEREEDDHTEVEMLLESYHKVCDEIVQASGNLVSNIRNTEEIVKAILDANRNSLMLLDLKFSIGTLGLGAGTFGAALYGMNLKNFIEESEWGFWGVSAWCSIFTLIVCMYGLRKLRRVQTLSMWGAEKGDRIRGKSGWANLGGVAGERPLELEPLVGPAFNGEKRRLRSAATNAPATKREWGVHAGGGPHAREGSDGGNHPYSSASSDASSPGNMASSMATAREADLSAATRIAMNAARERDLATSAASNSTSPGTDVRKSWRDMMAEGSKRAGQGQGQRGPGHWSTQGQTKQPFESEQGQSTEEKQAEKVVPPVTT